MAPLTPKIHVLANGRPVGGLFYQRLNRATLTDQSGQQSDTLECVFDNRGNAIHLPGEGDILEPLFGYVETGITSMGKFTVDGWTLEGGSSGEFLTIRARSADVLENQKEKGSEHFEDTTLGEMLKTAFSRVGATIEVADELASIPVTYEARFDQSVLDFATRLADRHGAVFKPGGGKFLFFPRGSQKTASGGLLRPVQILRHETESWSLEGKPRPRYGRVVAKWHDPATGKTSLESALTGGDGPIRTLTNPYKTKQEAIAAVHSEVTRQNRGRASGQFVQVGRTDASAEVTVLASGFGPGADGEWRAETIRHDFVAGSGGYFKTTIHVQAPETVREED